VHQDSDAGLDQEFIDELDLVVDLLKNKEGWEKFVLSLDGNALIHELIEESDAELSPEQLAVFLFWRLANLSIADDGEMENEFDSRSADDDNQADLMLFSLRAWKEQVLIGEILQSDEFIEFETLSGMIDDYAPRSRNESEAICAEFEEQRAEEGCLDQIRPLLDSEVPPVLQRRPGQGLSGH
jgi:hypothetical protein